jgi:hypothetical protein
MSSQEAQLQRSSGLDDLQLPKYQFAGSRRTVLTQRRESRINTQRVPASFGNTRRAKLEHQSFIKSRHLLYAINLWAHLHIASVRSD